LSNQRRRELKKRHEAVKSDDAEETLQSVGQEGLAESEVVVRDDSFVVKDLFEDGGRKAKEGGLPRKRLSAGHRR
jgi:hypothetical protein